MALIHHPVFQSLFLPVVAALLGMALLQRLLGSSHAAWGGWLGWLAALAWLPGFDVAPGSGAQKLPWVALAGLGLAVVDALGPGRQGQRLLGWLLALLAWAAAAAWLAAGRASAPGLAAGIAFGGLVLALLAVAGDGPGADRGARSRTPAPLATVLPGLGLVLASLGLAVLAGRGASLLLAQLALMQASALAMACGWAWRSSGPGLPPALRMSFGLAWLALAWLWVLAAHTGAQAATGAWPAGPAPELLRAGRVALLALALAALVWLFWPRARSLQPGRARWWMMLLAATAALLLVFWPAADGAPPGSGTPADADDPYITSTWQ